MQETIAPVPVCQICGTGKYTNILTGRCITNVCEAGFYLPKGSTAAADCVQCSSKITKCSSCNPNPYYISPDSIEKPALGVDP